VLINTKYTANIFDLNRTVVLVVVVVVVVAQLTRRNMFPPTITVVRYKRVCVC